MRILLTFCRQAILGSYQLPLGIGYISASLKRAGHDVRLVNPNHSHLELEELITGEIEAFRPEVVAMGGMALHFNEVSAVLKVTRRAAPLAAIIAGGPLITSQPETLLKAIPEIDFGVVGEGEHTIVELVDLLEQGADISSVQGIAFRDPQDRSVIHETARRPVPEDLDALPSCDYEGLGLGVFASLHRPGECTPALVDSYASRVMPILTSRGCPYTCTFCCHEAAGRRYRQRSLDSVFAEIEHAIGTWGINCLFICDDLFCLKPGRLESFCQRIAPLNLRWACSMTAAQINPESLVMMRESGCRCISIGVESMSQTVLTSMQKKATRAVLEQALPMILEARIGLWSNLIFGDPAETLETVTESLEWYGNHPEYNLRTAWIGYHPGSRIYDEALQKGLIGDPIEYLSHQECEINSTSMSEAEFLTARLLVDRALLSFGHAGRLLELFKDEAGHDAARCLCPRCGTEGVCHTIEGRQNFLAVVHCPQCNCGYRVPIFMRYQSPPELTPLLEEMRCLLKENPPVEAVEALAEEILNTDPCNTFARRLQIDCADHQGDKVKAARLLEQLICFDPYNPELFESMAERLADMNLPEKGQKYAKKAAHLRSMGITHTMVLNYILPPGELRQAIENQLSIVRHASPIASFLIGGGGAAELRSKPFQPFPASVELTEGRHGRLLCRPDDPRVGRSLLEYGDFDPGAINLFTRLVGDGAIVLDIGANIGAHTVPLAQLVGPEGVVVAFEPQPALHKILCANLVLNSVPNVLTYAMALGNAEGECLISVVEDIRPNPAPGMDPDTGEEGQTVPVGRLDDFQLERVDFIRLDVGGYESKVLDGAADTIERCHPILYIRNDREENSIELIRRLFDLGYRLWWHTPPLFSPQNFKNNPNNVFPGLVFINMVAIHQDMRPVEGLRPILAPTDSWR